jgi:hypothetical protein
MIETLPGICEWADATFGPANDIRRALSRANEEAAELITHLVMPELNPAKIAEECADIAIVLCRPARACGDENIMSDVTSLDFDGSGSPYTDAIKIGDILLYCLRLAETEFSHSLGRLIGNVLIKLSHICAVFGFKLSKEIDKKMARNRAREWRLDGSGHGYHTKEPEEARREEDAIANHPHMARWIAEGP